MDMRNREHLYNLVCARDKRYDGRFYCAVVTTGIYCRPICPARPKLQNVRFYRSAAQAEKAGFRACMRCRPDIAPHSLQWDGTAAVVGRALKMIARGDLEGRSLRSFSASLGLSDRHLRRLFQEHLGASPVEIASSTKLHLAKQLLLTSNLSVTEVGYSAGYRSIRRFNEVFKQNYRISPSHLRKAPFRSIQDTEFVELKLPVITPFNWDFIFNYLNEHRIEGVEFFAGNSYGRNFVLDKTVGHLQLNYRTRSKEIVASIYVPNSVALRVVVEKIKDLFDLRLNPHRHLEGLPSKDPLSMLYRKHLGVRLPGAWDSFETSVSLIIEEHAGLRHSRRIIKDIVEALGSPVHNPLVEGCSYLFPTPAALLSADLSKFAVSDACSMSLKQLIREMVSNRLSLNSCSDITQAKHQLTLIPGIGIWAREMIAMRCLGDVNAFPKTDKIIASALKKEKSTERDWSPWNAYISLAIWQRDAARSKVRQLD